MSDESVIRELLKQRGLGEQKPGKPPRYAWRFWQDNSFCENCLSLQPMTFDQCLERHDWRTHYLPFDGRPFPIDKID